MLSTQFTFGPLQMLSKKIMQFLIYYQNIIISEGSCDPEDWSHNRNTFHFKINSNRKQLFLNCNIFHNVTAFSVFVIINTSTVSRRHFFFIYFDR